LREIRAAHGPDEQQQLVGGKYHFLDENDVGSTAWTAVTPPAPFYSFVPRDPRLEAEWYRGWRLPDVMPVNVLGFQTHRDRFAIDLDRNALRDRIEVLRNPTLTDDAVRQRYRIKDNRDWQLGPARVRLQADDDWELPIIRCLYRPFDKRWCYFSSNVMDYPRRELHDHVVSKDNVCLLVSRQQGPIGYRHSWMSREPAESCVVSTRTQEQNYVFPLYRYPTRRDLLGDDAGSGPDGRSANFTPEFLGAVTDAWQWQTTPDGRGDLETTVGPYDIVAYIYALLWTPLYRARYADLLQQDFPRIMLAEESSVARQFINIGHQLMLLHLLEATTPDVCRLTGRGSRMVQRVAFTQTGAGAGQIWINSEQAFEPIEVEVWEFEVGGFQVCDKWLKDRRGRTLSVDDVETYRRLVAAVSETITLMEQLDEILDEAGGLPFTAPM
jgi:hypothetical protein